MKIYVRSASETSGAAMRKKWKNFNWDTAKAQTEFLVTDGDWEVWSPKTWEAAIYLGKLYNDERVAWLACSKSPSGKHEFDKETRRGPLYIILNKSTGERYLFQIGWDKFYGNNNRDLGGVKGFKEWSEDKPAITKYFTDNSKTFRKVKTSSDGVDYNSDELVSASSKVKASYSIPAPNECVPYWQFDKNDIIGSFRELVKKIKDNLSQLGFVSKVGTSGFESVGADTIGIDVDIEINKNADELSNIEIDAIADCGTQLGGKNFEL